MKKTEFCEKIDTYKYRMYIMAYAILQNEADAEDAVGNAILRAYEALDGLRDVRKFKAWILKITKNEALGLKRRRMELPGEKKMEELLAPVRDTYDELWDVVQGLKEEYRLVIILFYYDDLSIREIAKVLEISVGTVKSRLNRGRAFLKEALEGKG